MKSSLVYCAHELIQILKRVLTERVAAFAVLRIIICCCKILCKGKKKIAKHVIFPCYS